MHAAAAKRAKTGTRVHLPWPVTAEVDSPVSQSELEEKKVWVTQENMLVPAFASQSWLTQQPSQPIRITRTNKFRGYPPV